MEKVFRDECGKEFQKPEASREGPPSLLNDDRLQETNLEVFWLLFEGHTAPIQGSFRDSVDDKMRGDRSS